MIPVTPKAPFTADDYALWCENPLTQWVFGICAIEAMALQDQWMEQSWHGGRADPVELAMKRGQASVFEQFATVPSYASVCEIQGVEPVV